MRELGLVDPMSTLALDEWEIERSNVVINRKLGEGAFGMVYGGEWCDEDKQWVIIWKNKQHQFFLHLFHFQGGCGCKNFKRGQ